MKEYLALKSFVTEYQDLVDSNNKKVKEVIKAVTTPSKLIVVKNPALRADGLIRTTHCWTNLTVRNPLEIRYEVDELMVYNESEIREMLNAESLGIVNQLTAYNKKETQNAKDANEMEIQVNNLDNQLRNCTRFAGVVSGLAVIGWLLVVGVL